MKNEICGSNNNVKTINTPTGTLTSTVPMLVHESALAREERHAKRLVIALIVSIITLFLTNMGWLMYLSQYEFSSEDIELNADSGNANYIGEDGDIYNGDYQD